MSKSHVPHLDGPHLDDPLPAPRFDNSLGCETALDHECEVNPSHDRGCDVTRSREHLPWHRAPRLEPHVNYLTTLGECLTCHACLRVYVSLDMRHV